MRPCPICGEEFDNRAALKSHLYEEHKVTYAQAKGLGPKGDASAYEREREARMLQARIDAQREKDDPGPFYCDECGEVFSTRFALEKHRRDIRRAQEYEEQVERERKAYFARQREAEYKRQEAARMAQVQAEQAAMEAQRQRRAAEEAAWLAKRESQGYAPVLGGVMLLGALFGGLYFSKKREAAKK